MASDNTPFFSIIIPVYQSEQTLMRCIDSVIYQDEDNYEVLLIDDGSPDNSGKICDKYAEEFPDICTVIHKENEGPLFARLSGIELAKGQYYVFLDADDIFMPGILSVLTKTIRQTQADLVIMNYYRMYPDTSKRLSGPLYANNAIFEGEAQIQIRYDIVKDDKLNALWQKCVHCRLMEECQKFRKYGKMIIGEDKLISLHLIDHAKRIVYLSDGLYGYYSNMESITHRRTVKHYQDIRTVNDITSKYIQHWKLGDAATAVNAKNRVEFAIGCLYSACEAQNSYPTFSELYHHIDSDAGLGSAYQLGAKCFPVRKRLAAFLLAHRAKKLLYAYMRTGVHLKNIGKQRHRSEPG